MALDPDVAPELCTKSGGPGSGAQPAEIAALLAQFSAPRSLSCGITSENVPISASNQLPSSRIIW